MKRIIVEFEGKSLPAELFDERLKKPQVRKLIAGSLHEQHRDLHLEEVLCTVIRRPAGRMKRESKEYEAADSGQRRFGLGLGSHAAVKRFAACQEGKLRT